MRCFKLFLLSFSVVLLCSSCDKNNSKAKEIAIQFANAVNSHDKAAIIEMFPDSRNMPNATLVDKIDVKDVEVVYIDSLKKYEVKYGNEKKQAIVIKADSLVPTNIIDTYHIYNVDSACYEVALKTGVPVNKFSDYQFYDLMKENGEFLFLISSGLNLAKYLSMESYNITRAIIYGARIGFVLKNNSKISIKGEDYKVEIVYYDKYTNNKITTVIIDGKDIGPDSRVKIDVDYSSFPDNVDYYDLKSKWEPVFNNLTIYQQLLKYGDLKSSYYDDYVFFSDNVNGSLDFALHNKITDQDTKNVSEYVIYLVKNAIYAKHGYIFKDDELSKYFSAQRWYKGETTDEDKVYKEFNEIEKYNVDFINDFLKKNK